VEGEAVAEVLREIGVDMMQGYYVSHPKPLGSPSVVADVEAGFGAPAARRSARAARSRG
jgi:EAL domain-containing protein (putative c-di-GMP-specific phosphodiesterase class I)